MLQQNKRIPVTLITGYLGSGKTTLMNELLKNKSGQKIALIVNDIGSVNIDAGILKKNDVTSMNTQMIELQNGCICCTLRDEFMEQIEELSKQKDIESIMVEASGISNPASIADGFLMYQEMHSESNVYLNAIVTVVDADRIHTEFIEKLEDLQADITDGQEHTVDCAELDEKCTESDEDADIINLVIDQIEFCNLIILNKCDLIKPEELNKVKDVIRKLQHDADIIETIRGKVDPALIFTDQLFDYDKVNQSSAVQKALAHEKEHHSNEKAEYGITSFVYEDKRPFDYDKFMAFMEDDYPDTMIRAKGYVWFADDDVHVQLFEQAGRNASITEFSNWIGAFDEEERNKVIEQYPEVLEDWDEVYQDRLNQIVFIGSDYDQTEIKMKLDECLVDMEKIEVFSYIYYKKSMRCFH